MDVSIIIVNYNTIKCLTDAIDSVFEKTKEIQYEIIVVDNHSSDNSQGILAEKYGEKIVYMQLPENVGFGRANNAGAKIAKGRKLFLLNPDTKLINNAIKILSDFLDNNADVGCCGGNLYYEDGMPAYSFRKFLPGIFWELNEMFKMIPEQVIFGRGKIFNSSGKPHPVGYITGADLMIQKELFDALSGFNPVFFMYYEEAELQFRIRKLKHKIFSVPSAKIIHLEGKSITSNIEREKRVIRSRGCYYQATQGKCKFYMLKVMCMITLSSHFLVNNIMRKSERAEKFKIIYREARDFRYCA